MSYPPATGTLGLDWVEGRFEPDIDAWPSLIELAELLAKREAEAKQSAWIACSERMPEDDAQVLFTWGDDLTDGPVVCMGRWIAGDDGYWVDLDNDCADRDGDPQKRYPSEVTHWMPLPEAPHA